MSKAPAERPLPTVQRYMTTTPYTVGKDQPLSTAQKMMREHHVRHLPVLEGGSLVGILSDRDLAFVTSFEQPSSGGLTVEDAMSGVPYTVEPDAPLDEVVRTMAEHKYGSAVVVQGTRVVGIFTAVDALLALADLLAERAARSE